MKVIGLTGGFGTGKTFVASIFRSLGAGVCDADRIARGLLKMNSPVYRKIVAEFGENILDSRGKIDRKKLGRLVFADKDKVKRLNRIVHPEVIGILRKAIEEAGRADTIVIDAPLLIEAGFNANVDSLVVVKCSKKRQMERCIQTFRMKKDDVLRRIRSQMPIKEKIRLADFVVDNDGTMRETRKQVKKIWRGMEWK